MHVLTAPLAPAPTYHVSVHPQPLIRGASCTPGVASETGGVGWGGGVTVCHIARTSVGWCVTTPTPNGCLTLA